MLSNVDLTWKALRMLCRVLYRKMMWSDLCFRKFSLSTCKRHDVEVVQCWEAFVIVMAWTKTVTVGRRGGIRSEQYLKDEIHRIGGQLFMEVKK